ncbi:DMT family transporter [Acidaminobacter sp.]|uniref:DMT family transporter n=1 Tax=Acidaminobacter sp. TaxID=1872102 RepID=UPI00256C822E|nr:DMT family transporter [Acidaminobacter sp.]MDK9711678.1 DMT family transporter [Acidaminobacter sp.]
MNVLSLVKTPRAKAILYLVIASVLWSTGGMLIKLVDWNPVAIAGTRSGIAALVMLAFVRKPKFSKSKTQIAGAAFYMSTVILFVTANKLTTAANAILLQYTAPIWVAVLGTWVLKEKTLRVDWLAIFAVMAGMVLFFIGDLGGGALAGNLLSVLSGLFLALTVIFLRLQKDGSQIEMTLLGNIMTFLVSIPFILQSVPDFKSMVGILILGVFQLGISYTLFSLAVRHVTALEAILIPVIEPILNPIWVFLATGEKPGALALLGGLIVVLAVTLRSFYISRLGKVKEIL